MIDHIVLHVADLERSRRFYAAALAPLGGEELRAFPEGVGFGTRGVPAFWIATREPRHQGVHVAFTCATRAEVDAFHAAALAAGGRDHGPPGVRAHYHPNYYGAFVLDPDGNNIEAVCHAPCD